jgi:predicted N-acyltransferase
MRVEFISSINDISAAQWNDISGTDYPFMRHEFLAALENSGCTNKKSGWQPYHALVYNDNELCAVLPLYLKTHSYGEYVFDWSWADAYRQNGIPYYPKLLSAIPFTPSTGPRLCVKNADYSVVLATVFDAITQVCEQDNLSGWHLLFTEQDKKPACTKVNLMHRIGSQYHWFNNGYQSFDNFLADFSSRKRKNLRKERKRVFEQDITFKVLTGNDLTSEVWERFYYFYQITYAKRSGHGGYLNEEFFNALSQTMSQQIVLVMAYQNGQAVAGALNFKSSDTLYGRYWGTVVDIDGLHFETCYYQGIEYCIANGLQKFDPGAQGEHKIQRGFTPIETDSWHWLAHPGFSDAVADFIDRETIHIKEYIADAAKSLPFKSDDLAG